MEKQEQKQEKQQKEQEEGDGQRGGRAGRGSEAALCAAAPGAGAVAWPALSPRGCLRSWARNLLISNTRLRLPLRGKGAAPTPDPRALPSLSATHRRWRRCSSAVLLSWPVFMFCRL